MEPNGNGWKRMLSVSSIGSAGGRTSVNEPGGRFGKTIVLTELRGNLFLMIMLALVRTAGMKTGSPESRIVISTSVLRLPFGMDEIPF
jgi:hypothetical protein